MVLGIVIDRLLLESPLTDAPQIYRYTLLIRELGTEIVALTLHYRFYCATIVADSAIEYYEICLPHTYILYSFALFFYPLLLLLNLDSHYEYTGIPKNENDSFPGAWNVEFPNAANRQYLRLVYFDDTIDVSKYEGEEIKFSAKAFRSSSSLFDYYDAIIIE